MKTAFLLLALLTAGIAEARTVALPRRSNNTVYITDASPLLQPGDTVLLEGDYTWIKLFKIPGTKEQPIVFINKGLVTIGGYVPYTCVFNGTYFKILGNGDPELKYGIRLGKQRDSIYGSFGFAFGASKGVEVAHCEFQYLSCGILQNPPAGEVMTDCYYHDNYLHDFNNPKAKGRSEGFYLGNTKASTTRFENCRIENNIIENVSGDGIQASVGTFVLKGNTIRNYAKARLAQQRAGIIVGAHATADILDNVVEGGGGVGLQIFGCGKMEISGNTFKNIDVQTLQKEDIVYINGKTATPENPLEIDFHNNTFENVMPNRKIIYNGTFPEKTAGITFHKNKGLSSDKINLSKKDKWNK
jgi:hypothetical protein